MPLLYHVWPLAFLFNTSYPQVIACPFKHQATTHCCHLSSFTGQGTNRGVAQASAVPDAVPNLDKNVSVASGIKIRLSFVILCFYMWESLSKLKIVYTVIQLMIGTAYNTITNSHKIITYLVHLNKKMTSMIKTKRDPYHPNRLTVEQEEWVKQKPD